MPGVLSKIIHLVTEASRESLDWRPVGACKEEIPFVINPPFHSRLINRVMSCVSWVRRRIYHCVGLTHRLGLCPVCKVTGLLYSAAKSFVTLYKRVTKQHTNMVQASQDTSRCEECTEVQSPEQGPIVTEQTQVQPAQTIKPSPPSIRITSPQKPILVVGDMALMNVRLKTQWTTVNCLPWASVTDIRAHLKQRRTSEMNPGVKYGHIILHVGQKDAKFDQLKVIKNNIASVCAYAKLMSEKVSFSGPLPDRTSGEIFNCLSQLNSWLSQWCPENRVGFINHWGEFSKSPDLMTKDGVQPNLRGAALISKNLDAFLEGKRVDGGQLDW